MYSTPGPLRTSTACFKIAETREEHQIEVWGVFLFSSSVQDICVKNSLEKEIRSIKKGCGKKKKNVMKPVFHAVAVVTAQARKDGIVKAGGEVGSREASAEGEF